MPARHKFKRVSNLVLPLRAFALAGLGCALVFVLNNFITQLAGWPGIAPLFAFGGGAEATTSNEAELSLGLAGLQLSLYLVAALGLVFWVWRQNNPHKEIWLTEAVCSYIVRFGFWAVLLIGLVDAVIAFLNVEELLEPLFGEENTKKLIRAEWRIQHIHYPLLAVALAIAAWKRGLAVVWLALLIVLAELLIVISRFIFSYEQAFMGDLVRLWYAALFLFSSAHTLAEEGHVRVDVFYAGFPARRKALINALGSAFLGLPLCWAILLRGLANKASIINAPIVSYEISSSNFGLYAKYLMAAFLLIFALSMLAQFTSIFLRNLAVLSGVINSKEIYPDHDHTHGMADTLPHEETP